MMNLQPAMDVVPDEAVFAPSTAKQERRRASLATNRPAKHSRPLSWVFFGAVSMPRSEHLIPFLN